MHTRIAVLALVSLALGLASTLHGQNLDWNQWRGPNRDGKVQGTVWPNSLQSDDLDLSWKVKLPPSYSGPIVTQDAIYVTGTENETDEVVMALQPQTGQQLWAVRWQGSMKVPFFAASNGSWIRSTPLLDDGILYVAGMRDVLVALDAQTGQEKWRFDFVKELDAPLPDFGCVCSPIADGEALFIQAAASVVKLNKLTGKVIWRTLQDDGGMMGSAFSSPVISTIAGKRQLIVQTRQKLAGVDLESGVVLWEQEVPSFRGMNILTPVVWDNGVFTSTYQNNSWFFKVEPKDGKFRVEESWKNSAQGYMSTPVVIDGHAYLHLQNKRITCVNLATGERTWTSKPVVPTAAWCFSVI